MIGRRRLHALFDRLLDDRRAERTRAIHQIDELRAGQRALAGRQRALADDQRARAAKEKQRIEALREQVRGLRSDLQRVTRMLQHVYDEEPANRRRLRELRTSDDYELAFDEPDPLVSIVIPTYTNVEGLVERAVPSALAQTHRNVEVVVVGDCAPPETGRALAALDDPRVVYHNRERRGPYPRDPAELQFVKGTPPFNEAIQLARGRWIAPFADDDAMRPTHVEMLLAAAREQRCELCYGRFLIIDADGRRAESGEWPPELGHVALQAAIYHSGLTFIQHELADAAFRTSGDKSVLRRMLNAGVRFGFVDEVVVDYHRRPSEKPA